ncbi:MAG: histidine kinase dimerization/phospho-acceptor domain-containing protein [Gammaproteobacteria bacterium]|nr:histidine kinase dimerization/phospho-acceptor domain-containing protein [Gammaproteobacteria bacterium]
MNTPDDQPCGAGTQARAVDAPPVIGANQHVLSELAASFAHELNQPLAAIAAYADGAATLLRRDPEHALQALGIIQAIAGQALRAGEVIQQLRGAARPLPKAGLPLDPNALISTVLPLLQSLATQRGVELVIELRTPVPAVHGDAARLQALLILLFGSALDTITRLPAERRKVTIATDDGGRTVEVSAAGPQGMLFQVHLPRVDS